MNDHHDPRNELIEMMNSLEPEQLAELSAALHDALISAAQGRPSQYPINELVHISQEEARRICNKINLSWDT